MRTNSNSLTSWARSCFLCVLVDDNFSNVVGDVAESSYRAETKTQFTRMETVGNNCYITVYRFEKEKLFLAWTPCQAGELIDKDTGENDRGVVRYRQSEVGLRWRVGAGSLAIG